MVGRSGLLIGDAAIDAIIAAVTDVPCDGERCPRCHKGAPNAVGCALCNPAELGRRLKAGGV